MNLWLRRFFIILTVGGGFAGLVVSLQGISMVQNPSLVTYTVILIFSALYAYGILIGVRLAEGRDPIRSLLFYFALQIPLISSRLLTYRFCSGLQVTMAIISSGLWWDARLGSEFQLVMLPSSPLGFGLNFIALMVVFVLIKEHRNRKSLNKKG